MSIQSEVRFFRDVDSFDWHLSCHRNQIIRQEVYMKRALTVPQPRFCNLSLLSCTWLLISLHVDLQGFIQGFLAHVLILDVHSRCFPLACPALCRCHGHLCFSHACRRQEPQEPPANNFFQTFLCLPLGCFLLMFVKVFSTFSLPPLSPVQLCSRIKAFIPAHESWAPIQAEIPILRLMLPRRRDVFLGCHPLSQEGICFVGCIVHWILVLVFAFCFDVYSCWCIIHHDSFFMSVHFVAVWGLDARDHCGSHRADGTGNWSCDLPTQQLRKLVSVDVEKDAVATDFFRNFRIPRGLELECHRIA